MAIGSNSTTLTLEDVVETMLLEEIKQNNMEGLTKYALEVIGWSVDRGKGKFSSRKFKLRGRSKSSV